MSTTSPAALAFLAALQGNRARDRDDASTGFKPSVITGVLHCGPGEVTQQFTFTEQFDAEPFIFFMPVLRRSSRRVPGTLPSALPYVDEAGWLTIAKASGAVDHYIGFTMGVTVEGPAGTLFAVRWAALGTSLIGPTS